jgi:hypothetical protein
MKLKQFRVAPEILEEYFKVPVEPLIATGFPDDGKIVGACYDDHAIVFTVASNEFRDNAPLVVLFE